MCVLRNDSSSHVKQSASGVGTGDDIITLQLLRFVALELQHNVNRELIKWGAAACARTVLKLK